MYWFGIKKLERDLRAHRLSEYDKFQYAVALFVFVGFVTLLGRYVAVRFSIIDFVASLVDICLYAAGITVAYFANAAGDNVDFLGRLLSLFLVIGLRVIVTVIFLCLFITFILWIIWHISLIHLTQQPILVVKITELIITLGSTLWIWAWLYYAIKRVST